MTTCPQLPSLFCYLRAMWHQTLTCSLLWDRDSPADARADTGVDQEPGDQDLLYCHPLQGPTCKRLNCRACGRRPLWEASPVGGVPCARCPLCEVSSVLGTPVGGIPCARHTMGGVPHARHPCEFLVLSTPVQGVPCARHPMGGLLRTGLCTADALLPCPVDRTEHSSAASVIN